MTDAAASTSATAATAATAATLPSHADILGRFVQQKGSLLDTLHDTYSDDPTSEAYEADIGPVIAAERTHFLTAIKDDADAQEEAIRDWHATMKPFYSMCKPGQEASVVAARPFQLVTLKFPEMWRDVRLSGESRALLFQYVVNLNQAATMFCAVDADAMAPVMSALSESGIMDCISSGNTGDMDISGMMSKVTSLASSMTPENMASM
ncbi:MAG: hypothetical protein VX446_00835, partial [Bacteroidota bacterium]|nr:hypothetical protein [Bacteroidota bacterium]